MTSWGKKMPHPRLGYRDADGNALPGVTTVVGRYKDEGPLLNWRYNCIRRGLNPTAEGRKAANIGTAVHDAIERHIRQEPFEEDPTTYYELPEGGLDKAKLCYQAWQEWNDHVQPRYLILEPQMSHGVLGYGGTPDAICVINDILCVVDWKTSNAIYNETAMQVSAYKELVRCNYGLVLDDAYVLRMDKRSKTPNFEQYRIGPDALELYFEQFNRFLDAYKFEREHFPAKWEKVTRAKLLKGA